jgi:DNA-directed RNA polymerases I, II, and III subunit RPABC1
MDLINKHTTPAAKGSSAPPTPANIDPIWVDFQGDGNVGIKQMRAFAQHVNGEHFGTGILITKSKLSPAAAKIIPTVLPIVIEHFEETDLLVNITHHELVPTHVLLSKDDKAKLLERYRLKESQLPRIQVADPIAKYLGLRRGQVVKIIRQSETSGRYASYRWCI